MMRFRHRRSEEAHESESYYISMTDLMVGVLFIFIIMLAYFALNFRDTTSELTRAKDPQTTALLKVATSLQTKNAAIDIDYKNRIVCLNDSDLFESGGAGEKKCFAYSGVSPADVQTEDSKRVAAAQALFASALNGDLNRTVPAANVSLSDGSTTFDADRIFVAGTANLSDEGKKAVIDLAKSLALRLPCFAYGVDAQGCSNDAKMASVAIVATADINAFTVEGRAAQALSLERSVAFHQALVGEQPILERLRNRPEGGDPLIRVVTIGNSSLNAPVGGSGKVIAIQFQIQPR
ncbi:hypothetical protein [Asticcacaulis excentricus]|uniref:OmpA-like domain-containing protein n=1 Tax=Asticcacaulis excentricus (strain ATCC 15261 / DSM 4724 / KCTC 12464 / NCIMB 9791 / VKM B-1370 / CB 48) TaxID=573065 RepID=E8RMR4_ASTEC|nr:hypothetical protein [Asticcacaulis excentricus]ADU13945.1 hypothetical protein Astex_2291 [Asticcacaulis excentricus CB 48]